MAASLWVHRSLSWPHWSWKTSLSTLLLLPCRQQLYPQGLSYCYVPYTNYAIHWTSYVFMNFCPNLLMSMKVAQITDQTNSYIRTNYYEFSVVHMWDHSLAIWLVDARYSHSVNIFITIFAPRQPAVRIYTIQFFKIHSSNSSLLLVCSYSLLVILRAVYNAWRTVYVGIWWYETPCKAT